MSPQLNKGEWGEPYAAIRLLADGKLYSADEDGHKNPNEWMSIIELIRNETTERIVKYGFDENHTNVVIKVNGVEADPVPVRDFVTMADRLCREIQSGRGSSFPVSEPITRFFDLIEMNHLKAARDKSDIFLSLQDAHTGVVRRSVGFSIKSAFGKDPTLFNTSSASGAVYKLSNMNDTLMEEINSMLDNKGHAAVKDRCQKLIESGCAPEFTTFAYARRARCHAFHINLDTINPRLITVTERLLWNHFFENEANRNISDVMETIIAANPCNVQNPTTAYKNMVKDFLFNAYGGMTAASVWDGEVQANGGIIHVSEDGEVVVYHVRDIRNFRDFLYDNCYLEFPSTKKAHGDYGYVYKNDENEYFFNLNFQIRYKT